MFKQKKHQITIAFETLGLPVLWPREFPQAKNLGKSNILCCKTLFLLGFSLRGNSRKQKTHVKVMFHRTKTLKTHGLLFDGIQNDKKH